ncbi:hypothetical protein PQO03_19935 [Lentisphaera profundi]|uniref:Protein kinase domain-containing protein n=1 Tax=Lentisphaera profundi TaxID=1658616 RepID=A0ABY7VWI9_9BACT|nr:hypothetical protein [Lentisphaera profundi]WDE98092.1 hypothetical protein PQO03_19935 [Lentisphaera profundi]
MKSQMQIFDIYYIGPEITYSDKFPNEASDVYSLGMLLYYLITGITPHSNASGGFDPKELVLPKRVEVELSEDFLFLFKNMSKRMPIQRMHSYRQVLKMIENFYQNANHSHTTQMTGQKSEIYEKKDFLNRVAPFLSKHSSSSSSVYNTKPLSVEAIQDRIKTSIDLGISKDAHKKLSSNKRINKKRTVASNPSSSKKHATPPSVSKKNTAQRKHNHDSARPLHKKKQRHVPKKKPSSAPIIICLTTLFLVILSGVLFIVTRSSDDENPLASNNKLANTQLTTENKSLDSAVVSDKESLDSAVVSDKESLDSAIVSDKESLDSQVVEDEKKIIMKEKITLDRNWYLDALKEAEPDFTSIDTQFKNDQDNAKDGQTNTINFISNEINDAKTNRIRRILIELKSEVNTLVFQEKYSDAIGIYKDYNGPLSIESLEPRKALIANLNTAIQDVEQLKEHEITGQKELLASAIFKLDTDLIDEYLLALSTSPDIAELKEIRTLINLEKIQDNILNNFALSEDEQFTLSINNNNTLTAKIVSCDLDEKSIQITSHFQGRSLKQSVDLNAFDFQTLIQHIKLPTDNESHFARFMYCLFNENEVIALQSINNYSGPLSKDLQSLLNNKVDLLAEEKTMAIFNIFNLIPGDEITANSLPENDAIVLHLLLSNIKKDFKDTTYINDVGSPILSALTQLKLIIKSDYNNDIFIGPNIQNKYPHVDSFIFPSNSTLRLLPGTYEESIIFQAKKSKLIGTQGIKLLNSLIIQGSDLHVSNLYFEEGDINIKNDSKAIVIKNCFTSNGGIKLLGKTSNILIQNSFLRYINSNSSAQKTQIITSTICAKEKAGSNLISNLHKAIITDSILYSEKKAIFASSQSKASIKIKNCLLSGIGPLALLKNAPSYSLEELDDALDDVKKSLKANVDFKDIKKHDYRIKDFSPGFNAASDGKSIGATFSDSLQLRDDIR